MTNHILHPLPTAHSAAMACSMAVKGYVDAHPQLTEGEAFGKMYGVLVVEREDGTRAFLAAHSGLLGGRNNWPYFVPPVYDAQQPDGYFKTHEREISAINADIAALAASPQLAEAERLLAEARERRGREVESCRAIAKEHKLRRDLLRREQPCMDEALKAQLIRESQHDKAQLRRVAKAADAVVAARQSAVDEITGRMAAMKRRRRCLSDRLQRWLFSQYRMLNARGEERSLTDIFEQATHTLPPAGAGDCCAPKLLQYAYAHGLRPITLAEFWLGTPPPTEVRRHLHFYPPCRSKCRPILAFMLQGSSVEVLGERKLQGESSGVGANSIEVSAESIGVGANNIEVSAKSEGVGANNIEVYAESAGVGAKSVEVNAETITVRARTPYFRVGGPLETVYRDNAMVVVDKPSGMLSVPGKDGRPSVESMVRNRYGIAADVPVIVHRLDMDTSGLLALALTKEAHAALQRQFLDHTIRKRYVALLEGVPVPASSAYVQWDSSTTGTITLPLRPDMDDRPRQLVDFDHGRPAHTRFRLLRVLGGRQLIALYPITGRTHQLRMHCAHHLGLGCPILGDPLYGNPQLAPRLCLHAEEITFRNIREEQDK